MSTNAPYTHAKPAIVGAPGWNIVSAANSYFYLVGRASAMVLDVSGAPVHTGIDMSAVRIFSSNHLFCASLRPPCAGTTITWG